MTNPMTAGTAGPVPPGNWVADLAACTVSFTVRNFGLRYVTGQIPLVSAAVTVGPGGLPVGVRAELDAHGIDTGHRRRDSDLRGAAVPRHRSVAGDHLRGQLRPHRWARLDG